MRILIPNRDESRSGFASKSLVRQAAPVIDDADSLQTRARSFDEGQDGRDKYRRSRLHLPSRKTELESRQMAGSHACRKRRQLRALDVLRAEKRCSIRSIIQRIRAPAVRDQRLDGFRGRTRYVSTVDLATSMPSLCSSPTIRGEPQVGFACHIAWMSSRTSWATAGRPGVPC